MNEPLPEKDLEALFDRQRAADHERAPGFHAMRTKALATTTAVSPMMPAMWRWALSGAAALTLGLAAILSLHHPAKAPTASTAALARELEQIDAALQKSLAAQTDLTAWQSPTDFLLNSTDYKPTP
jgi:hypothetical protein